MNAWYYFAVTLTIMTPSRTLSRHRVRRILPRPRVRRWFWRAGTSSELLFMNISDLLLVTPRMQRSPTQLKSSLIKYALSVLLTLSGARPLWNIDVTFQNLHGLKRLTLFRDHTFGNDQDCIFVFQRWLGPFNDPLRDLDFVFLTSFRLEDWPSHKMSSHIMLGEVQAIIVDACMSRT